MGIIGLNNCAMQMGAEREDHLGWSLKALTERLKLAAESNRLAEEYAWMQAQIAGALADVETSQLVTPSEVESPTHEIVAKLRRQAQSFNRLRDETLRELERMRTDNDSPVFTAELESDDDQPPVSDEMLSLEGKSAVNPVMQQARRHLVARKRAALLAELLHARLTLLECQEGLLNPEKLVETIKCNEVEIALQTVLSALKSRYAGINMLEISTCGAIPPYNHLLGGKLAALLLFSPEIPDDYRRIYSRPSVISSQMKNAHVERDSTLVYLGTTSLYAHGSSQYERIRLPENIISQQQAKLEYKRIGLTNGYGTLQFLDETRDAVEKYVKQEFEFRDVNSIFGEGPSPKLRLLVTGLRELGFPPNIVMVHNRQRLIYSAELTEQAREYLNARNANLPDYLLNPENFRDATQRITAFWRKRWLSSRLHHVPSMDSLLSSVPWKLSDRIQIQDKLSENNSSFSYERSESIGEITVREQQVNNLGFDFWKKIASSGSAVTSEAIDQVDFLRIHVTTPLEDFIKISVQNGKSIFLTGNAGDGKTHLLRRLSPVLRDCGAVVIEDATALMRKNTIAPVLDRWREAVAAKKPFCIAINEYPLHLLRVASRSEMPELVEELDRQCRNRLSYGQEYDNEYSDDKLLVIDLSLRNPLHPDFAKLMLERLLTDSDLDTVTHEVAPYLASNLKRLRDKRVQERLFNLLGRLCDMGIRATIRELWILLARIIVGYRQDKKPPLSDSVGCWYYEVLFANDPRFSLSRNFQLVDPASFSHPIWDTLIEENQLQDWYFGLPQLNAAVRPDRTQFKALKRAFYFEHPEGMACFELEDADASEFRAELKKHHDDDSLIKRRIIKAINRAYCPISFPGCEDSIYLWNGHRFQEQPSRIFLANRHIPEVEFRLLQPKIPKRLKAAFPEYRPDHLILRYIGNTGAVANLRLDFPLYLTLQKLRRGIARKLLAEHDLFRLDAFLEALHSIPGNIERRIISAHLERRELLEIEISQDGRRYERISNLI
ncbi:MAG: Druantia anti-phage system protein DruA [Methylococcaceae bacterium]